jgi:hypothetical protein
MQQREGGMEVGLATCPLVRSVRIAGAPGRVRVRASSKDHVDKAQCIYGELGDNGKARADWLVIDDLSVGRSNIDPDQGWNPCDGLSPLPAIVQKYLASVVRNNLVKFANKDPVGRDVRSATH